MWFLLRMRIENTLPYSCEQFADELSGAARNEIDPVQKVLHVVLLQLEGSISDAIFEWFGLEK
jgi:hypothetical protein